MSGRSDLQERLVALFLRLNGYTTTGLIIHSEKEKSVSSEIDLIGVRFNYHKQPDRIIDCCASLDIPTNTFIDIIIAEVKGGNAPLQFNDSLKSNESNVLKLFRWLGTSTDQNTELISKEFFNRIQVKQLYSSESFESIQCENISYRPILFAPDRPDPRLNQPKFINGKIMLEYCWECFRPLEKRSTCNTDYSITNWGEQFQDLIAFFKDKRNNKPNLEKLYNYFKV